MASPEATSFSAVEPHSSSSNTVEAADPVSADTMRPDSPDEEHEEIVLEPAEEPDLAYTANGDNAAADPMNLDGSAERAPPASAMAGQDNADAGLNTMESRIPVKKDASLREFLSKMDEYAPIIPDAVTNYYLTLAGLPPPPVTSQHLARLLALATQKFVADIAADAYQYSRIRSSNTTSNNPMGGLGGAAGFGTSAAAGGMAGAAGGAKDAGGAGQQQLGGAAGKASALGVQRPGFGGGGQGGSQGRTVLTMEDLGMAVGEYGVNIKRGEFYR